MAKKAVPVSKIVRQFVESHFPDFRELTQDEEPLKASYFLPFLEDATKRMMYFQRYSLGQELWVAMGMKCERLGALSHDPLPPSSDLKRITGPGQVQGFPYTDAESLKQTLEEHILPAMEAEKERLWGIQTELTPPLEGKPRLS